MNEEEAKKAINELTQNISKVISIETAILVDGTAPVTEDVIEGYQALIAEACVEDDTLMESYTVAVQDLLKIRYKISGCKPFQWSSKEQLEAKFNQRIHKLTELLSPKILWHARFRDKNHRDKIRAALN